MAAATVPLQIIAAALANPAEIEAFVQAADKVLAPLAAKIPFFADAHNKLTSFFKVINQFDILHQQSGQTGAAPGRDFVAQLLLQILHPPQQAAGTPGDLLGQVIAQILANATPQPPGTPNDHAGAASA